MLDDLLVTARERAEHSKAPVRAAAFLRVARVETAVNPSAARNTFDRGIDAIRRLSGLDGEFLLEQAALIAAAVAPDLLMGAPSLATPRGFEHTILEVMLDHGHLEQAVSRLMRYEDAAEFPFGMMHVVIRRVGDVDVRIALLCHAIDVWRNAPPYDPMRPPDDGFIQLFQSEWTALPRAEALTVVREIVRVAVEQPSEEVR